jgi:SAM-dependent methyltransferase
MFIRAFLVFGLPGTGKSNFCGLYHRHVHGSHHFNLDAVFLSPRYLNASVKDIAQHIAAGEFDKKLFMELFEVEFLDWLSSLPDGAIRDVLIEGYELYQVEDEMRALLLRHAITEIVKIEIKNYAFTYRGRRVDTVVSDEKFRELIKILQGEDYKEVRPRINYQTFEDLEDMPYSRSKDKWERSGVALLENSGLFLDVGCNNGYMCFRAADKFKKAIGIDSCAGPLLVARHLNNHIYRRENVSFCDMDFYSAQYAVTANVIYCSSFLHYASGEQQVVEFFKKCHSILTVGGVLVVEVELYPIMREAHLDVSDRPAGGMGSYPNVPWLLDKTKDLYRITYLNKSIFQPGSNYDRYFFHFKKV